MLKTENHIIRAVWRKMLNLELPKPFPQMTYMQAMSEYGSDKPDLRIPIKPFSRIDHVLPANLIGMITSLKDPIIDAMLVPFETSAAETRKFVTQFLNSSDGKLFLEEEDGSPGIFIYGSGTPLQGLSAFGFEAAQKMEEQFALQDGNLLILQARKNELLAGGSTTLGNLRNALYRAAVQDGLLPTPSWDDFKPLWITDFPLFSPSKDSEPGQGGKAGLASTHHPFTSPKTPEDVDMLCTDPTKAIANHYDLVINGEEIGGGSQRIHHAKMQEFVFREVLQMDDERVSEFSHLLEALRAGCPPHSGIALGFDRLVAMIASCKYKTKLSMRDVIAFPKSGKGEDLMINSPGPMSEETLRTYHLQLRE